MHDTTFNLSYGLRRQLSNDRKRLNQVRKNQVGRMCHCRFQAHLVYFLPQSLNQSFLQRALVPLFGEWY